MQSKLWLMIPGFVDDAVAYSTKKEAEDAFCRKMQEYLEIEKKKAEELGRSMDMRYWEEWEIALEEDFGSYDTYLDMSLDELNFEYSGVLEIYHYV